ncbi:hydantoinase/oxoprolinase family protein [Pigmentiphaga soli]|uniref:Hydantoinase/oxoprolinase family protein n=1 Tax=Pigmentiphaga soli TaxID=1007095 RepID=A0ABP8GE68_9BURK
MRIGIDIGGTFTDAVAVADDGTIVVAKTPSTPEDPAEGVLEGLALLAERFGIAPRELYARTELLIHGTTVATNSLAERKGARVGIITTQGFRDVLELREGTKADRYDLHSEFPQPLSHRPSRLEVPERVLWNGEVATPLDETAARHALATLRDQGVEAVVACFLHSHVNPAHERRVRELVHEMGWPVYTVLSHEILASEGEYDRFSTASVNAYVGPRLERYLASLQARLARAGAGFPLMIMQSTGGLLPVAQAGRYAVGCVTSGPAGGAMATALHARLGRRRRVVAYDTGGTTTDISLIEDGAPAERRKTDLGDIKIAIPSIDIQVVSLGGGSIARIDAGGILTLGPDSAGARPGPACYGRGGEQPTLTDANLVLGYLSGDTFLGGRMPLSSDLARQAIERHVAGPLGLSAEQASLAIHRLASSRIAEGLRVSTLRRGLDPRELALLSFGGAGGVHVSAVARDLSIPEAIVPREASVFSALGFLSADVRFDAQHPFGRALDDADAGELARIFGELEARMGERLAQCGFEPGRRRIACYLDCRYRRQISTLEIPLAEEALRGDAPRDWIARQFEARYRQYFGHVHAGEAPVIETCRVAAYGLVAAASPARGQGAGVHAPRRPAAFTGRRKVFAGEWTEVPVFWFDELAAGVRIQGPALVESPTTTVLLQAGDTGRMDEFGSLQLTGGAHA